MESRAGILLGEERSVRDDLKIVRLAEELGYDSIWFGEHAGIRDALALMGMATAITSRLRIGSCAINPYTRNVGTVAAAANTLSSSAPGRIMLGIASGEEVLNRFGIRKVSPLNEMREFITSLKLLMSGRPVDFSGKFVKLDGARAERRIDVPVYLAATGFRMLSLGTEVADGLMLNFLVDKNYIEAAHRITGSKMTFQLIATSLNRDESYEDAKRFIAKFFYLSAGFFKSLIDPSVVDSVKSAVGGWPPSQDDLENAAKMVPDDVVKRLMAAGSLNEIEEYVRMSALRWNSYPIFYIVSKDYEYAMKGIKKIFER